MVATKRVSDPPKDLLDEDEDRVFAQFCRVKTRKLLEDAVTYEDVWKRLDISKQFLFDVLDGSKGAGKKLTKAIRTVFFDGSGDALEDAARREWRRSRCLWHPELAEVAKTYGHEWTPDTWQRIFVLDAMEYDPPIERTRWAEIAETVARGRRPAPAKSRRRA